jgi:hypothetical protein
MELAIHNVQVLRSSATPTFDVGQGLAVELGERDSPGWSSWYLDDPLAEVAEGTSGLLVVPPGFVASARALSREAPGSLGSTLPRSLPNGPRMSLPVPPGVASVDLSLRGAAGQVSLLDERGRFVRRLTYEGSPSLGGVVEEELLDGPSGEARRPEVEAWVPGTVVALAFLSGESGADVFALAGEPLGNAFDTLELEIPGAEPDVPALRLRRVPPSRFLMGSLETERGRDPDEARHEVLLRRPYLVSETETTLGQWMAVTGQRPDGLPPLYEGPSSRSLPVVNVSWDDVAGPGAFLEKVSALVERPRGLGPFRLPTEAEREYAARGGAAGAYGSIGNLDTCDPSCGPCPKTGT